MVPSVADSRLASSPEVIGFETEWIFPGALATRLLGLKLPSGTSTIAIVVVCGRYAKFVVTASPPARIEVSAVPTIAILNSVRPSVN